VAPRYIKARKRHLLVDTLGLPLSVYVTPANVHDRVGACCLLAGLQWVALILARAHHACTIGRLEYSAEPSVPIMPYGSITLKSAVGLLVPHLKKIWADRAYGGEEFASWCEEQGGWELEIVERNPQAKGFSRSCRSGGSWSKHFRG
jgi:putative transposase